MLIKWIKLSFTIVQKSQFHLTELFLHFSYPNIQAANKTGPIISDDQTFTYLSVKNKDFSWTFLQRIIETKYFSST